MRQNIFIIHGSYGNPTENWFPWLRERIEHSYKGIEVLIPQFPTPEGQSLESWRHAFRDHKSKLNSKSILVGHSSGPAFILDILQESNVAVDSSFMVVPFVGLLGNPEFDNINYSITDREFDWNRIKSRCGYFKTYYSDNDPYVPAEKSVFVSRRLNAEQSCIPGAGHFNHAAGYDQFPQLLDDIKKRIQL